MPFMLPDMAWLCHGIDIPIDKQWWCVNMAFVCVVAERKRMAWQAWRHICVCDFVAVFMVAGVVTLLLHAIYATLSLTIIITIMV